MPPDIEKGVAVFASENPGDHSFNRRLLADLRCCFVGGDDYRRIM
jgi:hypothetical protein